MTLAQYFYTYYLSIFAGWAIAELCVNFMRKTVHEPRKSGKLIDFYVGGSERFVATTLVLFAASYLPAFIGGWVALKFAAHWQRAGGSHVPGLVALVGSIISFSVAIGAGLIFDRSALAVWKSH
jgi:hypothetical protein